MPVGTIWKLKRFKTKAQIELSGLTTVIESLPVHEEEQKQTGNYLNGSIIINRVWNVAAL
jgi:D-mannonate dehydratase